MGVYQAWSTMEVVKLTGKKRSSVLKRLHKLESVGIVEKRVDEERRFFWLVLYIPERPVAPKLWKESKSIYELQSDTNVNGSQDIHVSRHGLHATGTGGLGWSTTERDSGNSNGPLSTWTGTNDESTKL